MAKKSKSNKLTLSFNKEELNTYEIKKLIERIIEIRMNAQRHNPYITIGTAEFEIISKSSEFVDKYKYENNTEFDGEVGKIKGKRLVLIK